MHNITMQVEGELVPSFMGAIAALHQAVLPTEDKSQLTMDFGQGRCVLRGIETTYAKELQIIAEKAWPKAITIVLSVSPLWV
jgi:hypothetical protein